MRLASWPAAILVVAAWTLAAPAVPGLVPPAARADEAEDRRAEARAAMADLASADDEVRTAAAARLVELGGIGATELALRGIDLDEPAWTTCAEAFARSKRSSLALTFVSAERKVPVHHARRLRELAHALDPAAGVERTAEETAAEVRRLLDEADRVRCATGYVERICLLGHAAVAPILEGMRDGDPKHPGGSIACAAVNHLAEREDLPAIRELVLAGKGNLVQVLARMQKEGVPEATDALLDAVTAGRLDSGVTRALAAAPDKARVLEVVNDWVCRQSAVADGDRTRLAYLFRNLDARESVPTLETWIATSSDPDAFVAIAHALVHFGNPRGVGLLVRIAGERVTRFPCRPSTPQELAAASAPGRLCPEGFPQGDRSRAAQKLTEIAGNDVFDVPKDWERRLAAQGPDRESDDDHLDRAAAAFRRWWEASKDRLRYDRSEGRWVFDP
jgi:hypothetical protein